MPSTQASRARPPPARRPLSSARRRKTAPFLLTVTAVALSAAALYSSGMLTSIKKGLSSPILNDVATDVDDPPMFADASSAPGGGPGPVPLPEDFKSQIRKGYPDLKPLVVPDTKASTVFAALEKLARDRGGWEVTLADTTSGVLQGVATTRLLRFRDDFVFRVKPAEKNAVVIDGRSRSRLGKGDLGANAARLEGFLSDLKKALLSSSSSS